MQVNGREIAVEDTGAGPVVLMIHGLGATSNFYQVQTDALAADHRIIRIDSAGAGRSPVADGISIQTHAEDAAAVLTALGVEQAAVVAHSMGTLTARALATAHPEMVTRLALLGAIREPADAARQAQHDRAKLLREKGTAAVAPGVVANALSEQTRSQRPEVAAFVRELVMRQDPEGYARNGEALAAATDPGPIAAGLPLLLITGSDDKVGPPDATHEIAAAHGDAQVEIIDGIGHWTALEAAARTTELLTKFL